MKNDMNLATKAIHAGQEPDPLTGAVITPIYQTTTYEQDAPGVTRAGYLYSRVSNPTVGALAKALAAVEGGEHGFIFSSGLGATTTMFMALLKSGDHVILTDDVYGGTYRLLERVLKDFGITASYVDMSSRENIERVLTPATRMLFVETPTNPLLKLVDLRMAGQVAKAHGLIYVVDNTFASPVLQQPLNFGADIVLYSTTKYIGGHSDVVGGALICNEQRFAEKLAFHQKSIGATSDAFAAWLTLRGLKTLAVRMRAHVDNAEALAQFLSHHPKVVEVIYPGLPSHPQYELAQRQMTRPGGMITVRLKGAEAESRLFLKTLRLFTLAESLGGIESLACVPSLMTHASMPRDLLAKMGITDSLIRLSVGIEDIDDLRDDLAAGLAAI